MNAHVQSAPRRFASLDLALPDIAKALAPAGASVVVSAPPGTGKTTRVPLELLGQPWAQQGRILLLEPRRLAARAAAARMAEMVGEDVGQTVGYRVRFDNKVGLNTRIEVLTEGLLVRRIQSDPDLEGVGLVIFDELHERHLQTDLSLALTLDARAELRPDLRIAVMSATLAAETVAKGLGGATVIEADGAAHPVETRYLGGGMDQVTRGVLDALDRVDGDVLVFLPGAREIRLAERELKAASGLTSVAICPLHGAMDASAQDRAIRPHSEGRRKVILATNIAESSLTIDGVRAVVDLGLARVPRFDASAALTRLKTERIALDSAAQRRGRAGRQAPGVCLRLWSVSEHERLSRTAAPELTHADLAPPLLQALAWGAPSLGALPLLDAPPDGHEAQAFALLTQLGAVNGAGNVTASGRAMAALPVHPRLAAMLLLAKAHYGESGQALACRLAALIEEGLPWSRGVVNRTTSIAITCEVMADSKAARGNTWRLKAEERVRRVEQALRRLVSVQMRVQFDERLCGELLLYAFPDRVAKRVGQVQFRMSNGRRFQLASDDILVKEPWLVVPETSGERLGARLYIGAPCTREAIDKVLGGHFETGERIAWDSRSQSVRMECVTQLGKLELERKLLAQPDADAVACALLVGIRELGLDVLRWTPDLQQLRARVALLRNHAVDGTWPDLSDATLLATLEAWLAPFVHGCNRREHLGSLDLSSALRAQLNFEQSRALDVWTPTEMRLPSGKMAALEYAGDAGPPVLAVPLQDMFGAMQTPTVLRGELAVQVHLLSPAKRPLQVTQDLPGFWIGQYAAVRKEMRGRYPKHYWPEDPTTAPAGVRTGKRRPGS